MARGKKTGGRDFVPGQVANPYGRPKTPADIKELRKVNRFEAERVFHSFAHMPKTKLQELLEGGTLTSLQQMIGRVMLRAMSKGDPVALKTILDRVVGPVEQRVAVFGDDSEDPIRTRGPLTAEERKALITEHLKWCEEDDATR